MSIGMLRTISFEWMEQCIWSEQAPGDALPPSLTPQIPLPPKWMERCILSEQSAHMTGLDCVV